MFESILKAVRIKTLVAGAIPVMVAHCLVLALGKPPLWWVTFCALTGALCIQIATNFLNDAIDFKKGADDEHRIGPQRVTQSGLMSPKMVMVLGFSFLIIAVLFGLPLVIRGGAPILVFGALSLFLAYGYTGGPFPLAYLGLGDLFVIIFFGLFAVAGTYYLHTLSLDAIALVAGLQVGFLATTLLAINNLRDSETDAKVAKRTLAVRFGDNFVRSEIAILLVFAFLLNAFYQDLKGVNLNLVISPLAVYLVYYVWTATEKSSLNRALGMAAALQMAFGILLSIGLII